MRFESTGSRDGSPPGLHIDLFRRKSSMGFTLLETLTALTILAISMVSLFDFYASGLRVAHSTVAHGRALILGQALLSDTVGGWKERVGTRRGRHGKYGWVVSVSKHHDTWPKVGSEKQWGLYQVRATVAWDKNRSVQLQTLKLGKMND
jgi:hypothetical protein